MPYKIKYSNELKHHGILGMKWGVWNDETAARYRGGSKLKTKLENRKANKKIKNQRKENYKNRRLLSDKELNEQVNRLEKERRLKELTKSDLSDGRNLVEEILYKSTKTVLTAVATGAGIYYGKKFVDTYIEEGAGDLVRLPKK